MSEKVAKAIDGMMDCDMALYEKILDTPGFAYYFNELVKLAEYIERSDEPEMDEEEQKVCKALGGSRPFDDKR
jgi:hypothetical protein